MSKDSSAKKRARERLQVLSENEKNKICWSMVTNDTKNLPEDEK